MDLVGDLRLENEKLRDLVSQVSESITNVGVLTDHNAQLSWFLRTSIDHLGDNPKLRSKVKKEIGYDY